MAKLIHDVVPPATLKKLPDNDTLIAALFIRGVTIEKIFGRYFEYEANVDARSDEQFGSDEEGQHGGHSRKGRKPLTVGDAELAGLTSLPRKPISRQPF